MKVLTLKFPNETIEVHMLNPGEHFDGFGGSRHPLVVGKTASLITRRITRRMGIHDTERNIHDANFWQMIGALLGGHLALPTEAIAHKPDAKPEPDAA